MVIRAYEEADSEGIERLVPRLCIGAAAWIEPAAMLEAAREWVRESIEQGVVWVAEDEGAVVGFVTAKERAHFTGAREAYVGELVVAAESERRGIGGALMAAVEGWARERSLTRVSLDTGAANLDARRFYAARGYVESDVRLTKAVT
ncbi:MAG TPA: GNAT family N-acetyltransferase [Gaiellaceae bacterium]|jgi:GNAT superfamily N-acetyltransferase|nr:GNAT family N-acetyltransferase [Gaiellaceae bacterium]